MDYLVSGGFVLVAIAFAWLAADIRRADKKWTEGVEYEKRCRREDIDRLDERYWGLRHEIESGFEAVGLERKPSRPSIGPSWAKKQD